MGRKRRQHNGRKGPVRTRRQPGFTGAVHVSEHAAFVETAEGSYRLTGRGLRGAMHGDRVYASVVRGPHGQRRAVVEHVIEHAVTSLVGTYQEMGPLGAVRPLDTRIKNDFFVLPTDDSPSRLGIASDDIVAARIVAYPSREESGIVTIERRVGAVDAPDLGIQCVMARFDLQEGYPDAALAEAEALTLDVADALADPLRRDIRDRFLLTIDPTDARDFDDAISVERTTDGGWNLGVHIADVSHYVPWGSSLDLEARRRSTSVYLADRVLPMLPECLSNGLCSLVPDRDRLAFTVDIQLDSKGAVRSYRMYPSVIRSKARLDYRTADRLLTGEEPAACGIAGQDAPVILQVLRDADELARARQRIRHARGAIDFETVEVHALLDETGMPVELVSRHRTAATGLIEEAMLLANECVAEHLSGEGVLAAFRVHEPPAPDNLVAAARVLQGLGAISPERAVSLELGDPHAIEAALKEVHGTPYQELANALLLRAMQRAVYKPDNQGHFALGAPAYCHFTSPIRRYPDLLVHRALKDSLAREQLGRAKARSLAPRLVGTGDQALSKIAPQLCRHASERERIADAAATATQKIKVAQFYGARIGERATGSVSWVDQMGVFVRLDDTGAEGLIRLRDLGGAWWDVDERSFTVSSPDTGEALGLGDRVVIEVAAVNVLRGHLDFKLVARGRALH